jgi:ubiquinol-cytochrome c reductase iron-sulfur subunit
LADEPPPRPLKGTLKGTEFSIAVGFAVAIVAAVALTVTYALGGQPQLEGALLFLALGGIGFGVASWGKYLMPNGPYVQERERLSSTSSEQQEFVESFERGSDEIGRRRFLRRLLGGAVTALGAALLFPIRSLGPNPGTSLEHTSWGAGARPVDSDGKPLHVSDLAVGGAVTVFPEGHVGDATAQVLLIRASDQPVVTRQGRESWSPAGYLAFSKVCTHAGCPVGLYQHKTQQLLCPCHQSLFDVLRGARPVFGPAPRSLPQLPLAADANRFLVAQRDFAEPIGPAFWNRS